MRTSENEILKLPNNYFYDEAGKLNESIDKSQLWNSIRNLSSSRPQSLPTWLQTKISSLLKPTPASETKTTHCLMYFWNIVSCTESCNLSFLKAQECRQLQNFVTEQVGRKTAIYFLNI